MPPTIRPVRPGDIDILHEINEANVPDVGSLERGRWDDLLDDASFSLVVEDDTPAEGRTAGIAGFCVVFGQGARYGSVNYRWFMDRYTDAMYLDRVAFAAGHQGKGLGTLLYAEVDRVIAREHPDMVRLTLEVNVDPPNDRSLAFHARRGFAEVGRQMTDYGIEVSLMERLVGTS